MKYITRLIIYIPHDQLDKRKKNPKEEIIVVANILCLKA